MLINYLAEIWGITIVVISFALIVKETNLKSFFNIAKNEDSLFLSGLICFVLGISMVFAHNVWTLSWQVVITILGWASLLKGLSLLFFPKLVKTCVGKIENNQFIPYVLMILLIVGLAITYFGFTA